MNLSEVEKAYLAGIIDGEGSICLARQFAKRSHGRYIYPTVRIANTKKILFEWIQVRVDLKGTFYESNGCLHICWTGKQAIAILKEVLPYFVIKRKQADVVLGMDKMNKEAKEKAGGNFGHGRPIPEYVIKERLLAFEEVKALNARGLPYAIN